MPLRDGEPCGDGSSDAQIDSAIVRDGTAVVQGGPATISEGPATAHARGGRVVGEGSAPRGSGSFLAGPRWMKFSFYTSSS